ncbi:MAG TPA: PilZ domain-containing protein [Anaeromyxobacteraceae bacterium]|nr:PilZ domain-containing protein [Anaeromyxobacteraceae bacterium]
MGSDADVTIALHLHLDRAGYAVYCMPGPEDLDPIARVVTPSILVLILPAQPDATWGAALTTAAGAARAGVMVVMVAPQRDVVQPLASVAGATRALSRAEVLARPLLVVERPGGVQPATPPPPPSVPQPPPPATPAGPFGGPPPMPPAMQAPPSQRVRAAPSVDLLALIDEELVDEPKARPPVTRVEVNVSLVSEHNFFVGPSKRIDSGGVFIATAMPPPIGTRLQVRLGLADGRKVDVDGEVVFVRPKTATVGREPTGCGVKLLSLPPWVVDAIDRFVSARQPITYQPR